MFDLLIRNGTIVDGTGKASFRGDVAVVGDKIAAVGPRLGRAKREIDAEGMLVTPGFVDLHTHYDGQVCWDPYLAPSSLNGVTSVAMGNCGVGFAPARPDRHDWLIALLEGVEEIPGTALAEGLTWEWESFPEYLDALGERQFALDVGAHFPHAALRTYVMGDRGGDHEEEPSDDEIGEMRRLTAAALAAGALGFTTSRTAFHRSRNGTNIGTLSASLRELGGICQALGDTDRGVIQLISDAYQTVNDDYADAELELISALARLTGRPLSFTVQQPNEAPDRWRELFAGVDGLVRQGLNVKMQVAPRPIGVILGFGVTLNPFLSTQAYRNIMKQPLDERMVALRQPEIRRAILGEHAAIRPAGRMRESVLRGFDKMFRMMNPVDYEPDASHSLAAEAAAQGRDPADYAYEVFLEENGRRLIYQPLMNFAAGNLSDVYVMMTGENTLYGLSDAGAHCGSICDGSFPTTAIGLWSHGNKAGKKIPIEHLVHGYTQRNARHLGWLDRGVVAPSFLADLNVIDLAALDLPPPRLIADLPAGGARLLQSAHGYVATIKSGVVMRENGAYTGALPGRLIRGTTAL